MKVLRTIRDPYKRFEALPILYMMSAVRPKRTGALGPSILMKAPEWNGPEALGNTRRSRLTETQSAGRNRMKSDPRFS